MNMETPTVTGQDKIDSDRRDFLRQSVYAAYATPLITTLLVTEKAAANSYTDCVRDCLRLPPGGGAIARCIRGCGRP
jgi:hypothetical protein